MSTAAISTIRSPIDSLTSSPKILTKDTPPLQQAINVMEKNAPFSLPPQLQTAFALLFAEQSPSKYSFQKKGPYKGYHVLEIPTTMHAKAGSIGTASIATKVAWKVYMGTFSKGEKSPCLILEFHPKSIRGQVYLGLSSLTGYMNKIEFNEKEITGVGNMRFFGCFAVRKNLDSCIKALRKFSFTPKEKID